MHCWVFWARGCRRPKLPQPSNSGWRGSSCPAESPPALAVRKAELQFSPSLKLHIPASRQTLGNLPHRVILRMHSLQLHIQLIHYYQGLHGHDIISQINSEISSQGLWVGQVWQLKINKRRVKLFIVQRQEVNHWLERKEFGFRSLILP